MVIANAFYLPRHLLPGAEPDLRGQAGVLPLRQFSRIVHANDGSEQAFRALTLALAIAKQNDADLHIAQNKIEGKLD